MHHSPVGITLREPHGGHGTNPLALWKPTIAQRIKLPEKMLINCWLHIPGKEGYPQPSRRAPTLLRTAPTNVAQQCSQRCVRSGDWDQIWPVLASLGQHLPNVNQSYMHVTSSRGRRRTRRRNTQCSLCPIMAPTKRHAARAPTHRAPAAYGRVAHAPRPRAPPHPCQWRGRTPPAPMRRSALAARTEGRRGGVA